jgi:hypothetical protein
MFNFFKKNPELIIQPAEESPLQAEEREILDRFPIGSLVEYLGVEMLVVGGGGTIDGLYTSYCCIPTRHFYIKCDYLNKMGEVKTKEFNLTESRMIKPATDVTY